MLTEAIWSFTNAETSMVLISGLFLVSNNAVATPPLVVTASTTSIPPELASKLTRTSGNKLFLLSFTNAISSILSEAEEANWKEFASNSIEPMSTAAS